VVHLFRINKVSHSNWLCVLCSCVLKWCGTFFRRIPICWMSHKHPFCALEAWSSVTISAYGVMGRIPPERRAVTFPPSISGPTHRQRWAVQLNRLLPGAGHHFKNKNGFVPLLLLRGLPIILLLSATLSMGMASISSQMQWPLASQSDGSILKE
jgi:hypothetical protein